MGKRTPMTFAKRQRELDKKKRAEEKRQRKIERRNAEPEDIEEDEPDLVCRPITDDEVEAEKNR